MQPYKSFGSFLTWYCGPSDEIRRLQSKFIKRLNALPRRKHPYMFRTPGQVKALVRDAFTCEEDCDDVVLLASVVFTSPAHGEQVTQGRGWPAHRR